MKRKNKNDLAGTEYSDFATAFKQALWHIRLHIQRISGSLYTEGKEDWAWWSSLNFALRRTLTKAGVTHGIRAGCSAKSILLGAFAKLLKATISFVMSVCPSVRLSAWYNSAPIGRIFTKFDKRVFLEKEKCHEN